MKPQVLVVDDIAQHRYLLGLHIRNMGCGVLEAASGEEALRLLRDPAIPVDVIITDVWMPEMSGVDLLRSIHAIRPDMPVALISAMATLETSLAAINAGAYAYLTKPFTAAQVRDVIKRALHHIELQQTQRAVSRLTELEQQLARFDPSGVIDGAAETYVSGRVVTGLIAGLRHQLGNMTAALKLNLDTLRERAAIPPDLNQHIEDMDASVDDLMVLLGQFKEYPDSNALNEIIDLRDVLTDAIELANVPRETFSLEIPDTPIMVRGAAPQLCRALANLLERLAEQGSVRVQVLSDEQSAQMLAVQFEPLLGHHVVSGDETEWRMLVTQVVVALHQGTVDWNTAPSRALTAKVILPLAS